MKSIAIVVLVGIAFASTAAAGPIDDLEPGHWYRVPNSNLRQVVPNPPPAGSVSAITAAWSGAAFDTKRDRLLVFGGGHADYSGNEIYAFDVSTLAWARIWGPSASIPYSNCGPTYPDGNPASRHSYYGLEYLPTQDAFLVVGGSVWQCGWGYRDVWTFDLTRSIWQRHPDVPVGYSTGGMLGNVVLWDSAAQRIHMFDYDGWTYDPATDQWQLKGPGVFYSKTGALDPIRRKVVFLGYGAFLVFDIRPDGTMVNLNATPQGATEIVNQLNPGVAYDPVSQKIIAWSGGTSIYSFDLDTMTWTRIPPAPTNSVTPAPPPNGTFGRFRYVPSKNAFISVASIDDDVYFYKLSPGGGVTDATPPSPPLDLIAR